jgi:hypothetical protein
MEIRIAMSRCFSTKLGRRAPEPQLRHARPHIVGSRLAVGEDVGEDRALDGRERLR